MTTAVVGNQDSKQQGFADSQHLNYRLSHMQPDDKNKCGALLVKQRVHISQSANGQLTQYPQSPTLILNILINSFMIYPATTERFHVLLNSLFKVLFNF